MVQSKQIGSFKLEGRSLYQLQGDSWHRVCIVKAGITNLYDAIDFYNSLDD